MWVGRSLGLHHRRSFPFHTLNSQHLLVLPSHLKSAAPRQRRPQGNTSAPVSFLPCSPRTPWVCLGERSWCAFCLFNHSLVCRGPPSPSLLLLSTACQCFFFTSQVFYRGICCGRKRGGKCCFALFSSPWMREECHLLPEPFPALLARDLQVGMNGSIGLGLGSSLCRA